MTKIAILGTGRMGAALAQTFLDNGHDVWVWNRTPARAQPAVKRGARLAESVRDAVSAADIVVAILLDYTTTTSLLHEAESGAALRGKVLVQLASGSPTEARALASWARDRGAGYLDGAIMATPDMVGKPECRILYAGERPLFEATEPTLRCLADATVHVGVDPGHAAGLDSAVLMSMWGVLFGALQGTAISRVEAIPLEEYLELMKAMLPVTNAFTLELIERAIKDHYDATEAALETHRGALQHVLEICRQRGLDPTVPEAFDRVMALGVERGLGGLDFTALLKVLR